MEHLCRTPFVVVVRFDCVIIWFARARVRSDRSIYLFFVHPSFDY